MPKQLPKQLSESDTRKLAAAGATQYRDATIDLDRDSAYKETRSVRLSFSSEKPVERFFGTEILDHSEDAVDLSRLNDGAAVLLNHDPSEQIGVVEKAWLENRRGRALVRFSKSARGEEIFKDIQDGIRQKVSVGYRIHESDVSTDGNGVETWRAKKWEPLELSIVSIPADSSVGIGRSQETIITKEQKQIMTIEQRALQAAQTCDAERVQQINFIAERQRERVPGCEAMAQRAISEDWSANDFRRWVFENQPGAKLHDVSQPHRIGMAGRDIQRYSIARAIVKMADAREGRGKFDGLEREMHDEWAKRSGIQAQGFWIPPDVILAPMRRDLVAGTATLGGNIRETTLLDGNFIDFLRNRSVCVRAGAMVLDGLVGNIAIPRRSATATTQWVTETGSATESDATFDQVTMTPKGVTAIQDYSKQLLIQSTPKVDVLVQQDLAAIIATEIDRVGIHGTGTGNQPTGIIATSGVNDVSETNGAALDWAQIVQLEEEVAIDNADFGALAYVTNPKVRRKLKTTQKVSSGTEGNFIWERSPALTIDGGIPVGILNDYRALVTNQVSSNLTQGTSTTVASAIVYGNWNELIFGMWSGLDVLTDPYTLAANRVIRVLATQYVDIGLRHAGSFAFDKGVLTT